MSDKVEQLEALGRSTFKEPPSDRDRLEQFEAKQATGFVKKFGKHAAVSGITDRSGRLKLLASQTEEEVWAAEISRHELIEIAERVLHGRNATVFDGLVLRPIRGLSKRTVDDLAMQFGVDHARIYRIKNDCIDRIKKEIAKTKPVAPTQTSRYRDGGNVFETCERCNREYPLSLWPSRRSVCRGNYDPPKECLIDRREVMWRKIKATSTPEKLATLALDYRAKQSREKEEQWTRTRASARRSHRDFEDGREALLGKQVWYPAKTNEGTTYHVHISTNQSGAWAFLNGDCWALVREFGGTSESRVLGEKEYRILMRKDEIGDFACPIEHAILRARQEARAERREYDLTQDIERNQVKK